MESFLVAVRTALSSGASGILVLCLIFAACGSSSGQPVDPVRSYLEGVVTVSAEVDSTQDYSGFEILVLRQDTAQGLDTLAAVTTKTSGSFATEVAAPERGVYPVVVRRRGTMLARGDLVVAQGDTARFEVELHEQPRNLLIRSNENAAWNAYRTAYASQNEMLVTALTDSSGAQQGLQRSMENAAAQMWRLGDTYPGTLGGELAVAQAVVMLSGWNDSLALARAGAIEVGNPRYADVARAVRQARARREGQGAAIAALRRYRDQADDPEVQAAIQVELVRARLDSLEEDSARAAVAQLLAMEPGEPWASWAEQVSYEIENLMPGKPAPAFTLETMDGETIRLADLQGRPVVLEFFRPGGDLFERQLPARNAFVNSNESLATVIVSLQPDVSLNETYLDGRDVPGYYVVLPEGAEAPVVQAYNVAQLPTRVLIAPDGTIVGKYVGGQLPALQEAAASYLTPGGATP